MGENKDTKNQNDNSNEHSEHCQVMTQYNWPCPNCCKSHTGKMDHDFRVTCTCGCKYDGLANAAQHRVISAIKLIEQAESDESHSDLRQAISILKAWL